MRSVRLIAASDDYDATPGLIIKGTPSFDGLMADRTGMMIAHDLLEHVNGLKHMGPVWDELEALGAIWQVRGRHGDLMQDRPSWHSPQSNVAADVVNMFDGWDGEAGGSVRTHAHDYDDDFRDIIQIARQDIPKNWPEAKSADIEAYLTVVLHRLRTGFRKAEKRYGAHFDGHNLFYAVREAVKAVLAVVEYEGLEFVLTYRDGVATCRPYSEEF